MCFIAQVIFHPRSSSAQQTWIKMTSTTEEKIMKAQSIRVKLAILRSLIFPNIKDFVVTFITTMVVLGLLFQMKKRPPPPEKSVEKKSIVNHDKYITMNGAWCWFADPRAVYYNGPREKRTYVGWVNNLGDIFIGGIDHRTEQVLPEVMLKKRLNKDDHANPSIMILQDSRLIVFYSAHNGRNMYYRISNQPEDISSWGPEMFVDANIGGKKGYTYPNPMILNQGSAKSEMRLFWRGGSWKPTFSEVSGFTRESAGKPKSWVWSDAVEMIVGQAARPYIKYEHERIKGKGDKVHMAFTDGHPRDVPTNSIYYACLQGDYLLKANGKTIVERTDLPVEPRQTDIVYDGSKGRAWVWDIAVDKMDKAPVIVYARFPNGKNDRDHRYHYVRWRSDWNGGRWSDTELIAAGPWFPQTLKGQVEKEPHYSAGISLDHSNPSRLVLSRLSLATSGGQFEVEVWMTHDKGLTWSRTPITRLSKKLNVRPIIPRHYSADNEQRLLLLWMSGTYQYWTNYSTAIQYTYL